MSIKREDAQRYARKQIKEVDQKKGMADVICKRSLKKRTKDVDRKKMRNIIKVRMPTVADERWQSSSSIRYRRGGELSRQIACDLDLGHYKSMTTTSPEDPPAYEQHRRSESSPRSSCHR